VIGHPEMNEEFEIKPPSVILFKQFDEGKNILSSDMFSQLFNFITFKSLPLFDEIGGENFQDFLAYTLPMVYVFLDYQKPEQKDEITKIIYPLAQATKARMFWVHLDWNKYGSHAKKLGLSGEVAPALGIDFPSNGTHYAFDEKIPLTLESIGEWIQQFFDGKLQPTFVSEAIPEKNDGPVTIAVGKTFEAIVMDPEKDVLLEIYAPWDKPTQQFASTYDQLGEIFKSIDSVTIAKIDATANDIISKVGVINVSPLVKFYPSNNKHNPIEYNGDKSLDNLIQFVSTNAGIKFTAPKIPEKKPIAFEDMRVEDFFKDEL